MESREGRRVTTHDVKSNLRDSRVTVGEGSRGGEKGAVYYSPLHPSVHVTRPGRLAKVW